jgi:hypothetical protein
MAGFDVPTSAHFCFWLPEGVFSDGFLNVVAYLVDTVGLDGTNRNLMQQIAAVLYALGKPFVILADWNFNPEVLHQYGWLQTIKGYVVAPARPTCLAKEASNTYDYAVCS